MQAVYSIMLICNIVFLSTCKPYGSIVFLNVSIETYGLHVLRPQPFQNMLKTSSDIIRFGTRLNLLTETDTGKPVRLKKPFT